MERGFTENLQEGADSLKVAGVEPAKSERGNKVYEGDSVQVPRPGAIVAGEVGEELMPSHENVSGDVNMEASISAGDVLRAGGFGARDDINSFLPVASDSTDFEAALHDARDYEEPQGEIKRPGLGWMESKS